MQIVDNIVILLLPVIAFIAGKKLSDYYHEKFESELQYMLRLNAAQRGIGYVAPPVKKRVPIGQPFMDKLKENGRATQQINSPQTP